MGRQAIGTPRPQLKPFYWRRPEPPVRTDSTTGPRWQIFWFIFWGFWPTFIIKNNTGGFPTSKVSPSTNSTSMNFSAISRYKIRNSGISYHLICTS